jgi:threonine dehydrogenase-like Zn-dependent dehydrogenase
MKIRASLTFLSLLSLSDAFVTPSVSTKGRIASTSLNAAASAQLNKGDAVLLIGPGFLQLNVAKAAKAAGLNPIIVAPQAKIDSFVKYVNDDEIINNAIIGIPDPGEPFYGEIGGVVYCAEDAILPDSIIGTVLDWKDRDVYTPDGIKRAVACTPIGGKINKEKSMGWVPIFNNDKKEKQVWDKFTATFKSHPVMEQG